MKVGSLLAFLMLTVFVAAGTVLVVRMARAQTPGGAPAVVPFTANRVERFYRHPTGEFVQSDSSVMAFASDGSHSFVQRVATPDGGGKDRRIVLNMAAKKRVTVDPATESVTTYYLPENYADGALSSCADGSKDQHGTILGFDVVREIRILPDPKRERRMESWRAPALNCFPLRQIFSMGEPGQNLVITNVREVTSVELGEPNPALFEIPREYVERSPSVVKAEWERRYPGSPCASCAASKVQDEAYQAAQRNRRQ